MAAMVEGARGFEFVIEREFDCPRDLMWRLWTEDAHIAAWFGPKGCRTRCLRNDFEVGGWMVYRMAWEMDGRPTDHGGRWVYREISPPERLVFISSFADPDGNPLRHPWQDGWPMQILSTVTFAALGDRTRVRVLWQAFDATDEELVVFEAGRDSMRGGWGGSFEVLAEYVASL